MQEEKLITIVIGKRGSGKSFMVKHEIAGKRRLVVFDVMAEYKHGVCFEHEDLDALLTFWHAHYKGAFRIIYRPAKAKEEIEWISRGCYVLGDVTMVAEECDAFCSPSFIPEWFSYVVNRGRHKHIELYAVMPAPFGIHKDLKRQAKVARIFRLTEPGDIKYLKDIFGESIEAKLAGLNQYEFVEWRDADEQLVVGKYEESQGKIVYRSEAAPVAPVDPDLPDPQRSGPASKGD